MGKYREIAKDLREPAKSLREAQPEAYANGKKRLRELMSPVDLAPDDPKLLHSGEDCRLHAGADRGSRRHRAVFESFRRIERP